MIYTYLAKPKSGAPGLFVNLAWACDPIETQHLVSGRLKKTAALDEL